MIASTLVAPTALTTAGAVALLALLSVLPLRGGHGQHAHAGPGSLNVWQLSDTPSHDRGERAAGAFSPPERRVHHANTAAGVAPVESEPESATEEIVWPSELPESWTLDGSSPLERALAEHLALGENEPTARLDYVGRHRLVEPGTTWLPPHPARELVRLSG